MSIKKLSLSSALSGRSHNPKKRSGGAKLSSAARKLIADGLSHREDNPRKKRRGRKAKAGGRLKKGSAEAKARMAKLRAMKGTKKSRKGRKGRKGRKAARRASSAVAVSGRKSSRKSSGRKASSRKSSRRGRKGMKGSFSGQIRVRNPSARVRHALARHGRKHNPSFDVKSTLIETAILLGGTLAALYVQPHINKFLSDTVKLSGTNLGYAKLVGAALTAAGGIFLQDRFGDKIGYDIRPATYALATFMAVEGFQESGLAPAADAPAAPTPGATPGNGTFALTGPAAGTFALTGPSMSATVLPNLNDPNAMLGSYGMHGLGYEDYGMHGTMGATVLANLPETNAMLGSIFDQEDSMHGTVFTAAELPQAVVAPHNVMQGGQVTVPQMC